MANATPWISEFISRVSKRWATFPVNFAACTRYSYTRHNKNVCKCMDSSRPCTRSGSIVCDTQEMPGRRSREYTANQRNIRSYEWTNDEKDPEDLGVVRYTVYVYSSATPKSSWVKTEGLCLQFPHWIVVAIFNQSSRELIDCLILSRVRGTPPARQYFQNEK